MKKQSDEVGTFKCTYFESSQIHQLTTIYCFEHTNHDVRLKFLFQSVYKLLLRTRNLHP